MKIQGYSSHISDQLYRNYDHSNPETIEEWKDKYAKLIKKKKEIESQLSNKNVLSADGKRMCGYGYNQRRAELVKLKNDIEIEIIDLKQLKHKLLPDRKKMEGDILEGKDPQMVILTLLKEVAETIKHIQFLLHRQWTDEE